MHLDELMRGLDGLDHWERLAWLLELDTTLGPEKGEALLEAMSQGDTQLRRLALHLAWRRRALTCMWRAIADPSLSVRHFAAKLVARYAEAIPGELLEQIDTASLATLLRELRRRGRANQAEGLVQGLVERERLAEAAALLPVCSPGWIAQRLDVVAWPESVWLRLARYRTDLVVARIDALFEEGGERQDLVWRRFEPPVWGVLARERPRRLMAWVEYHADADSLPTHLWPRWRSSLGSAIRPRWFSVNASRPYCSRIPTPGRSASSCESRRQATRSSPASASRCRRGHPRNG